MFGVCIIRVMLVFTSTEQDAEKRRKHGKTNAKTGAKPKTNLWPWKPEPQGTSKTGKGIFVRPIDKDEGQEACTTLIQRDLWAKGQGTPLSPLKSTARAKDTT